MECVLAGVLIDIWLLLQRLADNRNADSMILRRLRRAIEPNGEINERHTLLGRVVSCDVRTGQLCLVSTFNGVERDTVCACMEELAMYSLSCGYEETHGVIIMIMQFSRWTLGTSSAGVSISLSTFIRISELQAMNCGLVRFTSSEEFRLLCLLDLCPECWRMVDVA